MPPADTTISTAETLAGFVERQAQRRPDGIAIRYGDLQWSWADWASRIRRVAGALRARSTADPDRGTGGRCRRGARRQVGDTGARRRLGSLQRGR